MFNFFSGIKAHFNLDDSGLLHVTSVESVFEKTITVEEQEKAEAEKEAAEKLKSGENSDKNETEDSWAKLGDTISNFFGEKEETEEGAKEETKESKKDKKETKKDKKETKKKEEKPKKKKEFKPIGKNKFLFISLFS